MYRLMLEIVRPEFVAIWRLAAPPTRRSPSLVKATTLGVVRSPSALVMTTGLQNDTLAFHINKGIGRTQINADHFAHTVSSVSCPPCLRADFSPVYLTGRL